MKVFKVGGICLLTCLFVASSEEINLSDDLKDWNSEEIIRTGAIAESSDLSEEGEAMSQSKAETSGGGTAYSQSMTSSSKGPNSAQANSVNKADSLAFNNGFSNIDKSGLASGLMFGGENSAKAESIAKAHAHSGHSNYPVDWLMTPKSSVKFNEDTLAKLYTMKPGYSDGYNMYQPSYIYPSQGNVGGLIPDANLYGESYQPKFIYPVQNGLSNGESTAKDSAQASSSSSKGGQMPYMGSLYQSSYLYPSQTIQDGTSPAKTDGQTIFEGFKPIFQPTYVYPGHGISGPHAKLPSFLMPDARSRMIEAHEYIFPHLTPGYDKSVSCSRHGELHYLQSGLFGCMVCVCINEMALLLPACVKCSECFVPEEPVKIPPNPRQFPSTTVAPIPPRPEPYPEPQVSCAPLPSNQPFENPMNPCQICVCSETQNYLMKTEVRIECHQNPQCVIPLEVTTLPPIPDGLVPMPICERFPSNVVFPHPNDACKLCKCSVGLAEYGRTQALIECTIIPECNPVTYHPEPLPSPEVTTLVPWTTPSPVPIPKPVSGPLPGPKPHESCRPFKPDQPFQHPWDECQMCICSESTSVGLITIEVNCYPKSSCCYEPSELIGSVPVYSGDSSNIAEVHSVANSQSATGPINFAPGLTGYYPGSQNVGVTNQANTVAQAQSLPIPLEEPNQMTYQYKPGKLNPGQSQNTPINYGDMIYPGHYHLPENAYWNNKDVNKQILIGGNLAQWGLNQEYWPVQQPGNKLKFQNNFNVLTMPQNVYPAFYPKDNTVNKENTFGGIGTLVEQKAIDNLLLNYKKHHPVIQGYNSGGKPINKGNNLHGSNSVSANAADKAIANGKTGYPTNDILDGVSASSLNTNLYNRPSHQATSSHVPGSSGNSVPALDFGLESKGSGGHANAQSSAQSYGAKAKSQAEAESYLDKSGKPENFDSEED